MEYEAINNPKPNNTGNKWAGPCSGLQKQKADSKGPNHNTAEVPGMDAAGGTQFEMSVDILISDNRRRDLDGALATICDVMVAARRQLEGNPANHGKGSQSGKGQRRR